MLVYLLVSGWPLKRMTWLVRGTPVTGSRIAMTFSTGSSPSTCRRIRKMDGEEP
jgi:hypothetical protein